MYYVILTDHDPKFGGDTQYGPLPTRKEAQWYGEREVAAAKELGFTAPVTFKVVKDLILRPQSYLVRKT